MSDGGAGYARRIHLPTMSDDLQAFCQYICDQRLTDLKVLGPLLAFLSITLDPDLSYGFTRPYYGTVQTAYIMQHVIADPLPRVGIKIMLDNWDVHEQSSDQDERCFLAARNQDTIRRQQ